MSDRYDERDRGDFRRRESDYRLPKWVNVEEEEQHERSSEQHGGQMGDVGYRSGHREWQQRDLS